MALLPVNRRQPRRRGEALITASRPAPLGGLNTRDAEDAMPETDLDKPGSESMRAYAPTVGATFNMIGIHEGMHAAQFVVVRRKLDKPVLI